MTVSHRISYHFINSLDTVPDECEIVVHIGAPKSGTSAIQKLCNEAQHDLVKCGYYYPPHGLDMNGISGGHWELRNHLVEDLVKAEELFNLYLDKARKLGCKLLLSSESYWGHYREFAKILKGKKFCILAFARHPVDLALSNYNQLIKRHLYTKTLKQYIHNLPNQNLRGLNNEILLKWADEFGADAIVINGYEKELYMKTGIRNILKTILGVPKAELGSDNDSSVVNVSYPPPVLEFKRLANHFLNEADVAANSAIDNVLQAISDKINRPMFPELDPEDLERIKDIFEGSVGAIENRFGVELVSDYLKVVEAGDIKKYEVPVSEEKIVQVFKKSSPAAFLQARIEEVKESQPYSYELKRMCDLMEVEYKDKPAEFLSPKAMDIMLKENSDLADFCREIAIVCNKNGMQEYARKFIARAREVRPSGPVIENLYKQFHGID